MLRVIIFSLLLLVSTQVKAQEVTRIKVMDTLLRRGIPSVTISQKGRAITVTDSSGIASVVMAAGNYLLGFSSVGYEEKQTAVAVPSAVIQEVYLAAREKTLEEVIIASTRNNQPIENAPLKVEVLGREEMDEENTIKPGNIASILGDLSGVQIQQSSVASGNVNIRIQGLEGRYTQILRDGVPLYDGFSGGFGILSIPPLDLKQVELIKGSASTLYGGGAIGGLVNIISRRPTFKQEAVLTINRSTLKETNFNTFFSKRSKQAGYTFFAGYTRQRIVDVNKDGFSDLPSLRSVVLHPKLFFYPDDKTTIAAGYTATFEDRNGGDMQVLGGKADTLHQYFEKNRLQRHTGELSIERNIGSGKKMEVKSGVSGFNRGITTSSHYFKGNQVNYYSEISLLISQNKSSWVTGATISGDRFKKLRSDYIPLDDFSSNTIGLFTQYTYTFKENTVIEAGLRNDYQNRYGNFLLPRLAIFHRFNEQWGSRIGAGAGYKTPNPLAPQVTDYAIENILPVGASVKAETSAGYNAEVNYKKQWGKHNSLFINHAFFLTRINKPVIATEQANERVSFSNAVKPVVTKGFDIYIQLHLAGWELYAGYTYTIAERKYLQQNQFIPLTPKVRMAYTLVKEWNEKWRIGLEGSYTGFQRRQDYSKTPGYFFMAGMLERKLGKHVSMVVNGENLLDYRQGKTGPLFTGSSADPHFEPLWAPVDGRVINFSVKLKL